MALEIVERELQSCIDCHTRAPETQTSYTLISPRHGWRVATRFLPNGETRVEWRCPACWLAYRSAGGKLRS